MIYAVIDTNVLVSAFIPKNQDSSTAKVWSAMLNFDMGITGSVRPHDQKN